MINFKSVSIKNYQSIEDTFLPFKPGKHIILGNVGGVSYSSSNGSGKSSLIESIPFALYRDSARGNASRRGAGNCEVTLDFSVGNNDFVVKRYLDHDKEKNGVKLFLNGEDVSARGIRRIDKDIISAIGVPYDLFVSSIFLFQGFPVNICSMTPTARKSLIESMLGLMVWEDYTSVFSSAKTEQNKLLKTHESLYLSKKEEMVSMHSKIKGMLDLSDKFSEDVKNKIVETKSSLKDLMSQKQVINSKILEITTENLSDISSKSLKTSNKISEYMIRKNSIEKTLFNNTCPTCLQKYPESKLNDLRNELSSIEKDLEILKETKTELELLVEKVSDLTNQVKELEREEFRLKTKLNSDIDSYNKFKNRDDVEDLSRKLDQLNEDTNDLFHEFENSKNRVTSVENILGTLLPSSKFRTQMITKYLSVLNTILEEISNLLFNDKIVSLEVSANGQGIDIRITDKLSRTGLNYKSFSGGEKRRIDIILVFALQRFFIEASSLDSNLFVLDEIMDSLDTNGMSSVLSCLDLIYGENKCILFITHNEALKSNFDSRILVEKIDGISSVNYDDYRDN